MYNYVKQFNFWLVKKVLPLNWSYKVNFAFYSFSFSSNYLFSRYSCGCPYWDCWWNTGKNKEVLCMKTNCRTIYVSPNQLNLWFSVKKVKKDAQLKELKWLVNLIKEERFNCPKTIFFQHNEWDCCRSKSFNFIATKVSVLPRVSSSAR